MLFLRHVGRLLLEFVGFARQNKAWWIVPLVLMLLLLALLVTGGQSAAACIYAFF